ncbi:MAG: molybdopterin-binding protein [Proteobacteria bacterium]|nr:molybdopterin-binding protein [Pseudomonadota bacterium]
MYVLQIEEGQLHEDDAAFAMADAFCGAGVTWTGEPREGKINLVAAHDGLFKADAAALTEINLLGEVMCASRHTNSPVKKGEHVASLRAIPLVIRAQIVDKAVAIARSQGGLFRVKPFRKAKAGILITGSEVYSHLIEDQFEPVLRRKMDAVGAEIVRVAFAPDESGCITGEIGRLLSDGADLLLITGGMSVDPDDVTRQAVTEAGATDILYGAPVIPGAMFMIATIGSVPVLGVPACGLYHETTIFDLVLPRVLAGEQMTRRDIAALGHGGLCLHCGECRNPRCPFGKGD